MLKKTLLFVLVALLLLVCVLLIKTYTTESKQLRTSGERKTYSIRYDALVHLQSAIRIPTVSYDGHINTDTAGFLALHRLFDSVYPLTKQRLEKTVINSFSLIYRWKGKSSAAKPSILYAHLDVVPIESVNKSEWTHAPFSGDTAEGMVWGRGTLDDKGSAIAMLESTEALLMQGFTPENDIYLVFGHDEEIGGNLGAGEVAKYFQAKGIKTRFNLDEGGMCTSKMVPFVDKPVMLIGTAEKGYMTLNISVKIKGGHSSKPEKETSTGVLVDALEKINAHPFPAQLSPVLADFVDYVGPEMKMPARLLFTNRWLFAPIIIKAYQNVGGEGNAVTRTTSAITILDAGVKDNLIPGEAKAKVNFRILTGQTCAGVLKEIKGVVNDERVIIEVAENSFDPSPITSTATFGFKTTQAVCGDVFPDVLVSPFLMIGGTDSKHFEKVSESLIRCMPVRMSKEQLQTIHGVNERIGIHDFMEMIAFYEQMMKHL